MGRNQSSDNRVMVSKCSHCTTLNNAKGPGLGDEESTSIISWFVQEYNNIKDVQHSEQIHSSNNTVIRDKSSHITGEI